MLLTKKKFYKSVFDILFDWASDRLSLTNDINLSRAILKRFKKYGFVFENIPENMIFTHKDKSGEKHGITAVIKTKNEDLILLKSIYYDGKLTKSFIRNADVVFAEKLFIDKEFLDNKTTLNEK